MHEGHITLFNVNVQRCAIDNVLSSEDSSKTLFSAFL